jgi:hypothetical protein
MMGFFMGDHEVAAEKRVMSQFSVEIAREQRSESGRSFFRGA